MKPLTRQEEYILLSVFYLQENAYLITIRDHLKNYTGKKLAIGTIYVPIDRLRRQGYLSSRIGEPKARAGGRSIKYYDLTDKGVEALKEIRKVHDLMWNDFINTAYDQNEKS